MYKVKKEKEPNSRYGLNTKAAGESLAVFYPNFSKKFPFPVIVC